MDAIARGNSAGRGSVLFLCGRNPTVGIFAIIEYSTIIFVFRARIGLNRPSQTPFWFVLNVAINTVSYPLLRTPGVHIKAWY